MAQHSYGFATLWGTRSKDLTLMVRDTQMLSNYSSLVSNYNST